MWKIIYNGTCTFEIEEDVSFEKACEIFKKAKKKQIEEGSIRSFNPTYIKYYDTVHLESDFKTSF